MENISCDKTSGIRPDNLEFVVFCIENVADALDKNPTEIYDLLTRDSALLYSYIVPCYDALHTQGKEYIVNDIVEAMRQEGLDV